MFFKGLIKRKTLVDREVEIYRSEQLAKVNEEIAAQTKTLIGKLNDLAFQCAQQTAEYEHIYHYTKEKRGIELAKLNEQVNFQTEKLEYLNEMIKIKEEILRKQMETP